MMNLMIDIETLGTKPGCAILSIAAVPFGPDADDLIPAYYHKIDRDSCTEVGLIADPITLAWWQKQNIAAYAEAFSGKEHIHSALDSLTEYCKQWEKIRVWGNGASFDVPLLEAAYAACNMKEPWHYTNSMCYRTMKNLFPSVPYLRPTTAHNALSDATAQAAHLNRIFHFMNK